MEKISECLTPNLSWVLLTQKFNRSWANSIQIQNQQANSFSNIRMNQSYIEDIGEKKKKADHTICNDRLKLGFVQVYLHHQQSPTVLQKMEYALSTLRNYSQLHVNIKFDYSTPTSITPPKLQYIPTKSSHWTSK